MFDKQPSAEHELVTDLSHPPKPRLTVRVGVTGHRPDKLGEAEIEGVKRRLTDVFAVIEASASQIFADSAEFFADSSPLLRIVSGFAEGSDRIAVAFRPSGWQVEALLPFPRTEFAKDFTTSDDEASSIRHAQFDDALSQAVTITELPTPVSDRNSGYAIMGAFLLGQIDVLIAIWDGKLGKPGGAGALARQAYAEGIPVVWISTVDDNPARVLEGFMADGAPNVLEIDCCNGPLHHLLVSICAPPVFGPDDVPAAIQEDSEIKPLQRFFEETRTAGTFWTAYDFIVRLCNVQTPRLWIGFKSLENRAGEWNDFIAAAPAVGALAERISKMLLLRFVWADTLAIRYANAYRGTYVLAAILSFIAVLIALASIIQINPAANELDRKAAFVAFELCVVLTIVRIINVGRRRRWHEGWLDYRILAETLRHLRFLCYIGEFGRMRSVSNVAIEENQSWVLWYIRATVRELGMPSAHLDETFQKRILDATSTYELSAQLKHHRHNCLVTERTNRVLHLAGIGCFYATLIVLVLFLAGWLGVEAAEHLPIADVALFGEAKGMLELTKHWTVVVAAGLPALGAAIAGIRTHGDFEGAVVRSRQTLNDLNTLGQRFSIVSKTPDLANTKEALIELARLLVEDLKAWQALYGRKRLVLPA
jgi:hypothetical protein